MKNAIAPLFILLVIGCTPTPQATAPTTSPPVTTSPSPTPTTYTKAQYEAIANGATLAQVEEQLGKGEEVTSSEFQGIATKVYIWKNSDGSNITLTFQGDRVTAKAQFGLK